MSRISQERSCFCCGEPENWSTGCVIGPRCRCQSSPQCEVCKHCLDHHVKNCTEQVRVEAISLIAQLREKHHINIFDAGETKPRDWESVFHNSTKLPKPEKCYQCGQIKRFTGEFCDDCLEANKNEGPEALY